MDVTYVYKIYKIVEKAVIAYPQSDIFYYFYLFLLKYKKSNGKNFEFHNINLKDLESYYIFLYKISQDAKKYSLYEESQNISFDQINTSKESLISDSIITNTVKENEFKTKFFDNFVEHIGELNFLKKFTETKYKIFKNIYRMYDLDEMLERLFTELNPSYFRKNVVKRQNALKKIQFFILSCDHGTFDDFIDQLCTYIYEFLNDNDLVIETYNLISVLIYKVNNDSLKILYPIILEHIYKLKNLFELETNNNLNNNKIKTIFSLLKIIDVSVFTNSIEFKFYDVMKYFILENNIIKNQMNSNNVPLLCLMPYVSIYKYLSVFSDYYERFFIDNDDADYETLDLFILKNITE
ncbi:hypothetical protein HERIO_1849 [Hepatospora eriocheir]|uniref:Uncharacterized protein n=1 Tax=Hepatospora eriocheir TaxID=1081669 RepID=A0A1X0Q923_9MICR|nr:hypothetical protein HERIO_1849 [Hepatospora eriocheir]